MLIAEKVSLNSQVEGGSFSLKIYIIERGLYKQIKLIFKKKKSCNKSVELHCHYSTQKYDDTITRYFPFSKREFQKIECWVYIMHGKFSEVFLIILSLFSNLKLMSAFYSWKVFSSQVGHI